MGIRPVKGSITAPKDVHILVLGICEGYLTRQKRLCRCDYVKALAVARLSWIFWVGPK